MPPPSASDSDRESAVLLARVRAARPGALDALFAHVLPKLRRWAHGRLPAAARGFVDTSDVVQDVLLRTTHRVAAFDARGRDALAAYLRRCVRNRIADERRRLAVRGVAQTLDVRVDADAPSPLTEIIDEERLRRYRRALMRLPPGDRDLIVGHVELGYSHAQLACMTNRTPNAARMALKRAILRLAALTRDA